MTSELAWIHVRSINAFYSTDPLHQSIHSTSVPHTITNESQAMLPTLSESWRTPSVRSLDVAADAMQCDTRQATPHAVVGSCVLLSES